MQRTSALSAVTFLGLLAVGSLPASAAVIEPDMSSPDKTWIAVCAALKAEDLESFRGCFTSTTDVGRRFMNAYADMTVTTFKLANAISLIGGPQGKELSEKMSGIYDSLVKDGENRKTEIIDDKARWSRVEKTDQGAVEQVIYFRKVKGKWLIDTEESYGLDTSEGRKAGEDFISTSAKTVSLFKKIISDIQSNKITTLDELKKRLSPDAGGA